MAGPRAASRTHFTPTSRNRTARSLEERGPLGLLVENRLRLPPEPRLLAVVPALPLREQGGLARLVLRDLVHLVVQALLALAEGPLRLRDVHHGVPPPHLR